MPRPRGKPVAGERTVVRTGPGQPDEEEGADVEGGAVGEQTMAERARVARGGCRGPLKIQSVESEMVLLFQFLFIEI